MQITIADAKALDELEYLVERLRLDASVIVENLLVQQGYWVPIEALQRRPAQAWPAPEPTLLPPVL